mmetsp:Transcript_100634/g.215695  ORF Transcript_100634/g.215695 Transcript_100634/m.215695 type:complete len:236 (-) Transcript_100634:36-743(-)
MYCCGPSDAKVGEVKDTREVDVMDAAPIIRATPVLEQPKKTETPMVAESEFLVKILNKSKDAESGGIGLDDMDGVYAHICKVKPGSLVDDWNAKVSSDKQVKVGDYITRVNGKDAAKTDLIQSGFASGEVELTIVRPAQFEATIVKQANVSNSLGIEVACSIDTISLLIKDIDTNGAFAEWNKAHPDRRIQVDDRILSANGQKGEPNALEIGKVISGAKAGEPIHVVIARRPGPK